MNSNTLDMTKGTPWKLIISFAIPIFFSNLFQQLYNSVDSLIVGNFLGKEALAAVSSSGNLIFLFTSFFIGTSMGAGVIISKYFGEKNYENMHKAIHTGIALGLVSSVMLTFLGVFLSPTILKLMGTAENVLPNSIIYFRYYFIGVTGVVMYNIFNGILQAIGNSRRPLIYLIISSLTNIVLDLLFIGVFKWGVGSASIATAISQCGSALLCFIFLLKKGTVYQVKIKDIKFHKGMLKEILKQGIPSGVQNSVIALANVVVQSNINSFGDNAMAGCGSYSKIEGFAFLPITCFTMSITTFISQNLGAKQYDRAKKGSRFGIISSMVLAEIVGIIMYTLAPTLISLFSDEVDVINIGVLQSRTICLFYFLLAFSHCIVAVCRGAGKAFFTMLIMLIVWCGIRVLYITIAMNINHEIKLLFFAYPLTWSLSSIIFLIYYLFSDWIHGFDKIGRKEIRL
jgi:putative MATE family efflux protein